jgi:hypothetical protein
MNSMLVVGGLLVIGLVALLGAVFLAMGDRHAERRTQGAAAPVADAPATTQASEPQGRPTQQLQETQQFQSMRPTQTLQSTQQLQKAQPFVPNRSRELIADEPTMMLAAEEVRLAALNGQIQELTALLRAMHQQVTDLEQRLSALGALAGHIERSPNGYADEGAYAPSRTTKDSPTL